MVTTDSDNKRHNKGNRWTFSTAQFKATLDEGKRELIVDEQIIDVERRVLDVLIHLLKHAGEVVTKDELLDAVWPGRVVSDSAIAKCLSRAREALGDHSQSVIKTVRGFGYQLLADASVEQCSDGGQSALDLSVGDKPPLRPHWSLVEKLGTGGQGEVWLVRHDKTRELRVLKFALDETDLESLKREITISRYLQDSLGDEGSFLPILDWNLEAPPCFLESSYIATGNLSQWALARGGLDKIPMDVRLEIVARIANALARAHSVGVLHKDLKPSNVLIEVKDQGAPCVRLVDFGSAGIADVRFLEKMGITRMGFTRTIQDQRIGTTALYLAPEIMAGHQFSIQSDIYALGVMLYQMVVGDFSRPPSQGWEARVETTLLRADIAQALAGDLDQRFGDASQLAKCLRTLELREQEQSDNQARLARQKKAELVAEKARARRGWMVALLTVMVIGLGTSLTLYLQAEQARTKAAHAAAVSHAVANFLSNDMFSEISKRPLRELSVLDLLNSAAESLEGKFSQMPAAEAQLHAALGRAYWKMELIQQAQTQFELAFAGFEKSGTLGSDDAIRTAAELMQIAAGGGDYERATQIYNTAIQASDPSVSIKSPHFLELELNRGWVLYSEGRWLEAVENYEKLIREALQIRKPNLAVVARAESQLGYILTRLGQFDKAEANLRSARARAISVQGMQSPLVAEAQVFLGRLFMETNRLNEARELLIRARDVYKNWTSAEMSALQSSAETLLALIALYEGKSKIALAELKSIIEQMDGWNYSAEIQSWLAIAYLKAGHLNEAEDVVRTALELAEDADGTDHPLSQSIRLSLAEILEHNNRTSDASDVLDTVDVPLLESQGSRYPDLVTYWMLKGLIAEENANASKAKEYFLVAESQSSGTYGTQHPKTIEIRKMLDSLHQNP